MNPVHLYFLVVLLYPLVLFVQGSLGGPVAQGVQMVPVICCNNVAQPILKYLLSMYNIPEDLVHLLLHHHLLYPISIIILLHSLNSGAILLHTTRNHV
jgi:hypothetical protein